MTRNELVFKIEKFLIQADHTNMSFKATANILTTMFLHDPEIIGFTKWEQQQARTSSIAKQT